MKKIVLFLFFILSFNFIFCQSKVVAVEYIFKFQLDPSYGKVEYNAKLLFDKNESTFVYDQQSKSRQIVKKDDGSIEIIEKAGDSLGRVYYKNLSDKTLIFRNTPYKDYYLVEEDLPNINWELTDEKKEMLGYQCQEAKGKFRGRTYHAWFTTSIPVSTGPYKFSGLPGLILEIYDEEKEVSFTARSIVNVQESTSINPPTDGEKITSIEYFHKLRNIDKEIEKDRRKLMAKFERGSVIPGPITSSGSLQAKDFIERTHEDEHNKH